MATMASPRMNYGPQSVDPFSMNSLNGQANQLYGVGSMQVDPAAGMDWGNLYNTGPQTGNAFGQTGFAVGSPAQGGGGGLFGDTPFLSTDQQQGWGGMAMGAASGLFNAFMGMKQYGLAKDTLAFNKDQFKKNFAAQQSTTNASLADRQRGRLGSSGGTAHNYQSVGDYMNQYGIKG